MDRRVLLFGRDVCKELALVKEFGDLLFNVEVRGDYAVQLENSSLVALDNEGVVSLILLVEVKLFEHIELADVGHGLIT